MSKSAIVIGAGIVGLATARALSLNGFDVTVIERSGKAIGASVRNFGMVWPIGQPDGTLYNRAMRSRNIWKEIADAAGFWYDECGSLHLAYHQDEWLVLQELNEAFNKSDRPVNLMSASEIAGKINGVNPENLLGGLFSATEMIIDPREAIASIAFLFEGKSWCSFCVEQKCECSRTKQSMDGGRIYTGRYYLYLFRCRF